jgi:hypothetical protein
MSNKQMSTVFLLMAEFGQADVPLEIVAHRYLGLSEKEAKQRATARMLPIPAYRGSSSQKSPWLVRVTDLAEYLDRQREDARKEWRALNRGVA